MGARCMVEIYKKEPDRLRMQPETHQKGALRELQPVEDLVVGGRKIIERVCDRLGNLNWSIA